MIGIFDYTVVLTYLSLLSGMLGSIVALHGEGHPFIGILFLLFSGLCDTFDGKVARKKKNRSDKEKAFGAQIDSFADLIAFGVLPGCIGIALIHVNERLTDVPNLHLRRDPHSVRIYPILLMFSVLFYLLSAMIRLAWYNVLDIMNETETVNGRTVFVGLPVTSAALVFPGVILLNLATPLDLTFFYFFALILMGVLFLGKFRVVKPGAKALSVLLAIGAVEFILFVLLKIVTHFHFH